MFKCFPVTPLKFLIANQDALIPFLLAHFFCLKSKNLLFNFFFLRAGPLLATKNVGSEAVPPFSLSKTPVSGNRREFFLRWKIELYGILTNTDLTNLLLLYIFLSIFNLLRTSFSELSHVPYGNFVLYLFSNKEHF